MKLIRDTFGPKKKWLINHYFKVIL
jgi:hypothetical protein